LGDDVGRAHVSWTLELHLDTGDIRAGEVRRRVIAALQATVASIDAEAAEAVLGELLANVYRYAPGPYCVRLGTDAGGATLLEVSDSGPRFPYPALPRDPTEPGGHGLRLAAALSSSFAVLHADGRGNTVQAVLAHKR
jgi:anti-sigma regulatory factor (Ser/Thr protein kinase)